jgi:hypothetical protein
MKNCHDYDHLIIVHIIWLKKPIENVFLLYKPLQVFINVSMVKISCNSLFCLLKIGRMNIEINEGIGDVKGVGKVEELIDVLIVK